MRNTQGDAAEVAVTNIEQKTHMTIVGDYDDWHTQAATIIREAYAEQTAELAEQISRAEDAEEEATTQAAELEQLRSFKEEIDDAVKGSMDERCDAYEQHCTCVPVLRAEVKRLREFVLKCHECLAGKKYDPAMMDSLAHEAAEAAGGKAVG